MEIKFSRHSKRRMQLYRIDEEDVSNTIKSIIREKGVISGKYEEIDYSLKNKYHYPIKVVFTIEDDKIEVITTYPLKKERVK